MRYLLKVFGSLKQWSFLTLLIGLANSTIGYGQGLVYPRAVSTNPKAPDANKPRPLAHLGDDIPIDIDKFKWVVKPPNDGEPSVPTFLFTEVGNRLGGSTIARGTEVKPDYMRRVGSSNYFCVPVKAKQGVQPQPPPYNCEWVPGRYLVPVPQS